MRKFAGPPKIGRADSVSAERHLLPGRFTENTPRRRRFSLGLQGLVGMLARTFGPGRGGDSPTPFAAGVRAHLQLLNSQSYST